MVRPETSSPSHQRMATFALLTATLFWGCGFTRAKSAGAAVNEHMGLPHGSPLGPIWLLSCRFALAGILWIAAFPAARRGWTLASVARAAVAGTFLASALVTQHLGLHRTSAATTESRTSAHTLVVPL